MNNQIGNAGHTFGRDIPRNHIFAQRLRAYAKYINKRGIEFDICKADSFTGGLPALPVIEIAHYGDSSVNLNCGVHVVYKAIDEGTPRESYKLAYRKARLLRAMFLSPDYADSPIIQPRYR